MRGIFVYKSTMGYTVHMDGHTLDLDLSWSEASELAKELARLRIKSGIWDGRGFARCTHAGNEACFKAEMHLTGTQ